MAEWAVGPQAEVATREWAAANGRFFSSRAWADVIAGLGCDSTQAWNESRGFGVLVPVFRRVGLRVGFLGFPVFRDGQWLDDDAAVALANQLRLDILRINHASPGTSNGHAGLRQPDAWICDLRSWTETSEKRRARDVAFAKRATQDLDFAAAEVDPGQMHRLYAETVRGHGGKLRYTEEYFRRLVAASGPDQPLQVFHGHAASGELLGFAVLAADGDTGHYLHAAIALQARSLGLSDRLLSHLLAAAKQRGLRQFNLMASPREQVGLLKFKRKWADSESEVITRDLGASLAGRAAVQCLAWMSAARARSAVSP
jgi:ribosomal protein S18 acetylase RimI-like enzyme